MYVYVDEYKMKNNGFFILTHLPCILPLACLLVGSKIEAGWLAEGLSDLYVHLMDRSDVDVIGENVALMIIRHEGQAFVGGSQRRERQLWMQDGRRSRTSTQPFT